MTETSDAYATLEMAVISIISKSALETRLNADNAQQLVRDLIQGLFVNPYIQWAILDYWTEKGLASDV